MLFKLFAPHQVLHCFLTFVIDISFCVFYQLHAMFDISRLGFAFVIIILCLKNTAECFAPCSATLRRMLQVVCLIFVYLGCVWCGVLRTSLYDPSHNVTSPGVSPRSQELWNGAKHSSIALKIKNIASAKEIFCRCLTLNMWWLFSQYYMFVCGSN